MTDRSLERLTPLAEPVRRALFEYVVGRPGSVDRDEAAAAVGIGRPLAAFHLDRLAAAGLLDVDYRRRSGRSGPGAGRPAKFYRRVRGADIEVSLPPRRYALAAGILAAGVESASEGATDAVIDQARAAGRELAEGRSTDAPSLDGLLDVLRGNGYEPIVEADGTIALRNCPFDALVRDHRGLTCSMNLALLGSVAAELPGAGVEAIARPHDGLCCVAFVGRDKG